MCGVGLIQSELRDADFSCANTTSVGVNRSRSCTNGIPSLQNSIVHRYAFDAMAARASGSPGFQEHPLEQTQFQLNLGDSRFRRLVIPFVSAGQEAGRHDTSPVDGSA